MNTSAYPEKRVLIRLLCNSHFSESTLKIICGTQNLISINFHRKGMAVFCTSRLPEFDGGLISFGYQTDRVQIRVDDLPFLLKHRHETENGSQYGLEFVIKDDTPKKLLSEIEGIEKALENDNDSDDRYGLFH